MWVSLVIVKCTHWKFTLTISRQVALTHTHTHTHLGRQNNNSKLCHPNTLDYFYRRNLLNLTVYTAFIFNCYIIFIKDYQVFSLILSSQPLATWKYIQFQCIFIYIYLNPVNCSSLLQLPFLFLMSSYFSEYY